MRTQKSKRPPSPPLVLRSELTQRIADVAQHGVSTVSLARAIESVLCLRTCFLILAGHGRATAVSLCGANLLAEVVGGVDRDQRVEGMVLDAPDVALTGYCLCQLAAQGQAERAFATRRLTELEDLHGGFGLVELPAAQEAA